MEPLAAVVLFSKVTESNVKFYINTGDDDSKTNSLLKQKVPYGVEKWSDNNSVLSQKVINYLVKSFTYCIAQNKGDVTNMKAAIQSIVPHAFDDHSGCRETLCRYKKDPSHCHIVTEIFPMAKTSKEIAFNQP